MLFQKQDRLVMIGDSITDCGRKKPEGEGRNDSLGNGYVALVDSFLQSVYPQLGIRVTNMGISGNTVRNLKDRWETDVVNLKPDWVSIMIGINDVWRQYDLPQLVEKHVYIDEYEQTLRELVERTKPSLKSLILMTPYYIEPNRNDGMRAAMDQYGAVVKKIADQYGAIFIDTQEAFEPVLKHIYPATLAWDRVHPNMTGHMTLARAFLNAVGFSWNGER
ncbi:SGNH/GDSL hydrolase family protein [Paenibacillus sp. RC67]|uniref:SGNH/GDSL hydrolase family protein n=1 Tax=Paenibacillus sp. RC67 TaxID=3039392 RepID=UPI0024AE2B98|nr:SGNH/GDSL hydrolase family protein [Paenibacillus sp. RC67]